jgi:hypothetical protein
MSPAFGIKVTTMEFSAKGMTVSGFRKRNQKLLIFYVI